MKMMGIVVLVFVAAVGILLLVIRSQLEREKAEAPVASQEIAAPAGPEGSFRLLAASPDGRYLAGVSETAGLIRVFNLETGKADQTFPLEAGAFPRYINQFPRESLSFSPDGETLVFKGLDQVVCRWQLKTALSSRQQPGDRVVISPDTKRLALLSSSEIRFVTSEGKTLREVPMAPGFDPGKAALSPDGTLLFGEAYEYDPTDIKHFTVVLYLLPAESGDLVTLARLDRKAEQGGVQDQITSLTVGADGRHGVILELNNDITVYDLETRAEGFKTGLQVVRGLTYAQLSPDGQTLVALYDAAVRSGSRRRYRPTFALWSLKGGEGRSYEPADHIEIVDFAFSADSRFLYFNAPNQSIKALELSSLSVTQVFGVQTTP